MGVVIDDYPDYLLDLTYYLSDSRTKDEIIQFLIRKSDLKLSEAELVFDDLYNNRIISEFQYDRNERYSRHKLYYDLVSTSSELLDYQERLANKKVGLIGMGGMGSNIAMNLAAAGVGTLVFSDGDIIEKSNLTRQFLYTENDIGRYKVDVAKERLHQINSEIQLIPIRESVSGVDFFYRNDDLNSCDFIIISADTPAQIHDWINTAAIDYGFAYSNAGYIEKYGIVGPMVIPGETACYECYKFKEYSKKIDQKEYEEQGIEHNQIFQAPSYGPLNSLIASIQSNEAIRYLLNFENKTKGIRLLVDSENYRIYEENTEINSECSICGELQKKSEIYNTREKSLTDIYSDDSDLNLNDAILNPLMKHLISSHDTGTVLELGAATGKLGKSLKQEGFKVDFNDISSEMLENSIGDSNLFIGDFREINLDKKYDIVICNNVLDYVDNLEHSLSKIKTFLKDGGYLYLTIPHPLKGNGYWDKSKYNGRWNYEKYSITSYFDEGVFRKEREDSKGNVILTGLENHHRTLSTYFNSILSSGLEIEGVYEAQPDESLKNDEEILYEKSSKIPYFLTFKILNK